MASPDVIAPAVLPKVGDYPAAVGVAFAVAFTAVLVVVAAKLDPTMGVLTISLLVVVAFIATVLFCLFFTVPNDEINSAAVGGLIAAFGAVVAHWLGKRNGGPK
jgi:uncharacterized BrkB/YihY/UPF0761 family membrane protein